MEQRIAVTRALATRFRRGRGGDHNETNQVQEAAEAS